jgi:hypothetical protein
VATGQILITQDDEAETRPAVVITIATSDVAEVSTIVLPSENAVVADDGSFILSDKTVAGTNALTIYDASFTVVAVVTGATISQGSGGQGNVPVAYDGTYFYCAQDQSGTVHVSRISLVGTIVDSWTFALPVGWLRVNAIAVSRDSATLFYSGFVAGDPIKRWDLVNDMAMADFFTPPVGEYIVDLYVMRDDTLLFGVTDYSSDTNVVRYDMAGALVMTYPIASDPFGGASTGSWFLDHLAPGEDDPDSFWIWFQQTDINPAAKDYIFRQVNTTTGATITTIDDVPDQVLDAVNGVPDSCPLVILGSRGGGGVPHIGIIGPILWWRFAYRVP